MRHWQRTLRRAVSCSGVGVHSGVEVEMTLRPAAPETGIVFRRVDLAGKPTVAARHENVTDTRLCTGVGADGQTLVGTIEHLMAAFAGLDVDNALVDLGGPEVPAMDGSAAPFVELINNVGLIEQAASRRYIEILEPIRVSDGIRSASLLPAVESSVSLAINFDNPVVGRQVFEYKFARDGFETEVAPARTFGFIDDIDRLRAAGLALGGSLDNAVVVGEEGVLNPGGLRFDDEFVRHKVLDAIGDLYLAGAPILGRFKGNLSGHPLNHELLGALFAATDSWRHILLRPFGRVIERPARTANGAHLLIG
jgi:UDP-3-O-[3-hydroxymyristoyl] N-acetylglucosamine deacetylase